MDESGPEPEGERLVVHSAGFRSSFHFRWTLSGLLTALGPQFLHL